MDNPSRNQTNTKLCHLLEIFCSLPSLRSLSSLILSSFAQPSIRSTSNMPTATNKPIKNHFISFSFCGTSHLMSLRFYLNRVSILALIRYNAPRSVSESVGIRPILTALRTGLVYRSTPVMRYVVIRLCYHLLGRHTAYYRSCVPLGLIGRK